MGIDVVSAAAARSLEICSGSDGSIRRSGRRKFDPRAIALSANIELVLAVAGLKASEQLKVVWPKFSAATYHRLANAIPFLLGTLSFAAIFTSPGAFVLSTIAVLPTAFRLAIAARSRSGLKENIRRPIAPGTPDEDLPVYSVIVPLRSEARMVDQLLSAIERLDYPPDRLDVIIAVEADCHDTRASITARSLVGSSKCK